MSDESSDAYVEKYNKDFEIENVIIKYAELLKKFGVDILNGNTEDYYQAIKLRKKLARMK